MSEGNDESLVPEASRDSGGGKGKQMANKAANKAADKGKKLLQKAGKKGAAKGKLAAAAGPVLFWAAVIIVIIIILIGIIMFFATMPGMVMEKLKQIFKELGNYLAAFFGADTTKQIDPEQIYETLDYLEDMGYDVKGYGFLTGYYDLSNEDDKKDIKDTLGLDGGQEIKNALSSAGYKYDKKIGVIRDTDNHIKLAKSDFIFTYITSDNYVYTLKNSNVATQNAAHNWLESFFMGVVSLFTKMFSPLLDLFGATEGLIDTWGKGLIVAWYENGGRFGEKGEIVNTNNWANHDTVKIDMEKKQLILAKNGWFSGNNPMTYSLDGWTGRYGMPLEFLLSAHVATMMPDLSYDMATSFNTNVNMYLHKVSGQVKAYYNLGTRENPNMLDVTELDRLPNIESKIVWCVEHGLVEATDAIIRYDSTQYKYEWQWSPVTMKAFKHFRMGDEIIDIDGTKYSNADAKAHFSDDTIVMRKISDNKFHVIDGVTGDKLAYSFKTDELLPVEQRIRTKVENLIRKIKDIPKNNYETYIPYIADVRDHWYRDVFFIVNTNSRDYTSSDLRFVRTDYDYEALYRERWTLYETYSEADISSLHNDDYKILLNEFKLYLINDKGEYIKTLSGQNSNKIHLDPSGSGYYVYLGTKEEAESENITVSKRADAFKISDTDELKDLGWNRLTTNNNIWSAYKVSSSGNSEPVYLPGYTEEQAAGDPDKERIYSGLVINDFSIKQEGEGLRTETNPQIKKMFLTNTYFRYDGTVKTAEVITALRNKILNDLHRAYGLADDKEGVKYGPLNEYYAYYSNGSSTPIVTDVTGYHYRASQLGLDHEGEDTDYYVKDYSGQVTLNQDSLNAFTMLENTHTLDADYIYRDFKELVVELGYFTREELTDEVPKLLSFPIPQTGSYGYPDRSIDKRENEYGTMIHSKGDIAANSFLTVYGTTADEEGAGTDEGTGNTEYTEFYSDTDLGDITSDDSENIPGSVENTHNPEDLFSDLRSSAYRVKLTNEEIVEDAEEMWFNMGKYGKRDNCYWEYCVGHRPENCSTCIQACKDAKKHSKNNGCTCTYPNHCNHYSDDGRPCGYRSTFEASVADLTHRNVCCAVFVSWVLKELGVEVDSIMNEFGGNWAGAYSVSKMCVEYLGAELITSYDELKPGDIMAYVNKGGGGIGHVDILGESNGSSFTIYGCGKVPNLSNFPSGNFQPTSMDRSGFESPGNWEYVFGMRLSGQNTSDFYRGYLGNEAVVSPVTGILLEYGTYSPNEETKQDWDTIEDVGYRVNVDLKYGPLGIPQENNGESEGDDTGGEETTTPLAEYGFESQIVSDKVGYAKILVLNKEYYYNLEQSTENSWNTPQKSLLQENGKFREELVDSNDGTILAIDRLHSRNNSIKWSDEDQTIYGYKEFAELYEKSGIAGYILLIDGFVCEEPDNKLGKTKVPMKIPYENDEQRRIDATYTIDPNVTTGINFTSVTFDNFKDQQLDAKYPIYEEYKTASKKATDKLMAEQEVKSIASASLYIDDSVIEEFKDEKLIYIKEGTILGRTMTDKELLETDRIRTDDTGTYDENRPYSTRTNIEENDRIIGNYVRVIMRDLDGTPVEDVEDFMKLDDMDELTDDILFMAGVITAEAGGKGDGAKACAWVIKNRVDCGSFQDSLARVLVAPMQFTVVNKDPKKCSGWIYQGDLISIKVDGVTYYVSKPTQEAIEIAKRVYNDEDYQDIKNKLKKANSSGVGPSNDFERTWGRLYWKSAGIGSGRRGAMQIPEGKGNWFHF